MQKKVRGEIDSLHIHPVLARLLSAEDSLTANPIRRAA